MSNTLAQSASATGAGRLSTALAHLSRAPGKRLRPRLLLLGARAVGGTTAEARAQSAAEAIELIHTYSLVHDDLPAMDDDSLRRGQATLHIAFDEATAILVGDGLQSRAFELLADDEALSDSQRVRLVVCLAKASGFEGMVGGQSIDMEATGQSLDLDQLKAMHALKTGALIIAALLMGAIVADASSAQQATLQSVGEKMGLAFQIIDDVLDVRSDSATLGKTAGKDAATSKSTYVGLMGLEAAEAAAAALCEEALEELRDWDSNADGLRALMRKMVRRDR